MLNFLPEEAQALVNEVWIQMRQNPYQILNNGLIFNHMVYFKADDKNVAVASANGFVAGFALAYCMQNPDVEKSLEEFLVKEGRMRGENIVNFFTKENKMSNTNNHPETTGDQRLAALQAAGQFTEYGPYNTLGAATVYAIDAAYDQMMSVQAGETHAAKAPVEASEPLSEAVEPAEPLAAEVASLTEETVADEDEVESDE